MEGSGLREILRPGCPKTVASAVATDERALAGPVRWGDGMTPRGFGVICVMDESGQAFAPLDWAPA